MTPPSTPPEDRLVEARKQISLAARSLDDPDHVDDLERAAALVEGVEGELADADTEE